MPFKSRNENELLITKILSFAFFLSQNYVEIMIHLTFYNAVPLQFIFIFLSSTHSKMSGTIPIRINSKFLQSLSFHSFYSSLFVG